MLSLIRRIHRAVVGTESWHAAWQAVKTVLKEHWPDALPSIGLMVSAVWTWLSGSAVPWAILAGIFAFVMLYVARVAHDWRHGRLPVHPVSSEVLSSDLACLESGSDIPQAIKEQLTKLAVAIGHSSEFAAEISRLSSESAINHAQLTILRDVLPRLSDADQKLMDIEHALGESGCDLQILLDYCVHNLTYQMLTVVRRHRPDNISEYYEHESPTERWIKQQGGLANDYVNYVLMELGATRWGVGLRSIVQHGESEGDRYVSSMPKEKRPADIDPYEFRQYAIAKSKYDSMIRFLQATADEEEEKLVAYLENLRERLQKRAS